MCTTLTGKLIIENFGVHISIVLYETHWNFTSTVTKHDCHDYIGQIKNQIERIKKLQDVYCEYIFSQKLVYLPYE